MGFDHRGRPTGNNHRPTPRLARSLAGLLNNSLSDAEDYGWDPEEAEEEFHMKHSMAGYLPNKYGEEVSEMDAQQALDKYRTARNTGEDLEFHKEDIKDAYRGRNDY